jgi:hypothetical protein
MVLLQTVVSQYVIKVRQKSLRDAFISISNLNILKRACAMIILIVVLESGEKTEFVCQISGLYLIYFRRYSPLNSVPE